MREIKVIKRDFDINMTNFDFNKIELAQLSPSEYSPDGLMKKPIKEKSEIKQRIGIYICPFGFWNYQIAKIKSENNSFKLDENLEINKQEYKLYSISEESIISEIKEENFQKRIFWNIFTGKKDFPLFAIYKKEWFPIFQGDDDEEDLFKVFNDRKLFEKEMENYKYYYNLYGYINYNYNYN